MAQAKEKSMRLIAVILVAACASPAALAQNWIGMLKNTPAERFDDEDLRIFMDTARKALNEAPLNQPQRWENPKTRASGSITVLRSFESKGLPCKEVQLHNEVPGRKGGAKFSLCKLEDKWRLVSAPQLEK
jgi:surface antigen